MIPDSVTEIDRTAFGGCSNLVDVTLPNSLSTIKFCVFSGCVSLEAIVIPSSVTTIELNAFLNCNKLTSIFIPESVSEMTDAGFGYYQVFRIVDGLSYLDTYKIDDVKIYGYNKTAAQVYAYDNEFEFKNIALGNVDFDSYVTVLDATLLQRYCATKVEFDNVQLKIADIDKNSSVDINDVTAIQRMIVEDYEYI